MFPFLYVEAKAQLYEAGTGDWDRNFAILGYNIWQFREIMHENFGQGTAATSIEN